MVLKTQKKPKKPGFLYQCKSKQEKLYIIFDGRLKFQYHIENWYKKVSLKLCPVSRVVSFANLSQKKNSFNIFSVTV